jgi:hypothetical protein
MESETLRVHAPSKIVFLCGGIVDETNEKPVYLRDAFYRSVRNTQTYKIILAEDAEPLTPDAGYKDLFSFESDIAQVVGLIILFAESPGSLAELGAFAALPTVSPSLLAIVDDYYYGQKSFIRDGPLRYLENVHGEEWIHTLDRSDIGICSEGRLDRLDTAALTAALLPAIQKRLDSKPTWQKLDKDNSGHAILVIAGLCQEYGALTITEIRNYLTILGIDISRVQNYIYCCQLLGWINKVRKGNNIYHVAIAEEHALDYKFKSEDKSRDKIRWRSDIRTYWQRNEGPRHRVIVDAIASSIAQ